MMQKKQLRAIIRSSIPIAIAGFMGFASNASEKPNVILIYADDLGYGDVGSYGATKVMTPHIDRLAEEGRLFTDAHSPSAICTPSRYGLLTGIYPFRADGGRGLWGPLPRDNKLIIDTEVFTIADMMQEKGYATACIGKWHLGFGNESPTNWNKPLRPGPLQLGFDYYFGLPFVNSAPPYVYVENEAVFGLDPDDPLIRGGKPVSPTQEYPDKSPNDYSGGIKAHELYKDDEVGIMLVEKAVNWIEQQKEKPFFLFFSTTHIHHPFSPNEKFQGTSDCGRYGDFVHELDWMVGQLLELVDREGLWENTLIIFTSDNGGMLNVGGQEAWQAGHRMNGELLGFKFDIWEGGHRVPFIARWPGNIEPGTKSDQLLSQVDLFATFAALTGYELSTGDAPDSYNMLPALIGDPISQIRDHLIISAHSRQHLGLRVGDWMYIPSRGGGGWTHGQPGDHILGSPMSIQFANQKNSDIVDGRYRFNAPDEQLYNLKNDLSQTTNLVETNTEKAHMMRTMLRFIRQTQYTRVE